MNEPRNETQLVARIVAAIKEQYPSAWILKVHGDRYQRSGVPDLLICIDGKLIAVEVKHVKRGETEQRARARTTKLQLIEIGKIGKAGGTAGVALSIEETLAIIRSCVT